LIRNLGECVPKPEFGNERVQSGRESTPGPFCRVDSFGVHTKKRPRGSYSPGLSFLNEKSIGGTICQHFPLTGHLRRHTSPEFRPRCACRNGAMTVRLEISYFTESRPRWARPSGAMIVRLAARDAGPVVQASWPVIAPPGKPGGGGCLLGGHLACQSSLHRDKPGGGGPVRSGNGPQ
jgi:hypothetical protein